MEREGGEGRGEVRGGRWRQTHLHIILHKHHECSLVAMVTTVVGCREHGGDVWEGEDGVSISLVREAHTLWSGGWDGEGGGW